MSHYPSTQELAAFRRSIPCTHDHTTGWEGCPFSTLDRAHDSERRDGIGHRDDDWLGGSAAPVGFRYTFARRKASALRSRAYWNADCPNGWGLFASYAERVGGIPYWDDPIVSTDTWSEDEPRHPLPIRYQPSFTIG